MESPSHADEVPSVAVLLDDARDLVVAAQDRGEEPQYLLVNPRLYEAVAASKARETGAGRPLRLLGLLLVNSASTPLGVPAVK